MSGPLEPVVLAPLDGLDPAGGWRRDGGRPDWWSAGDEPGSARSSASSAKQHASVEVDSPAEDAGSHLVGPELPALRGDYRVSTWLRLVAPARGLPTLSADLLLNATGVDHCYALRFRVRNGVRYVTLVKRAGGAPETLVDDIHAFGYDRWLAVDVTVAAGRIEIALDGRPFASVSEFDQLTGGAVGIGGCGATARFAPLTVTPLGPAPQRPHRAAAEQPARRGTGRPRASSSAGSIGNDAYQVRFTRDEGDDGAPAYRARVAVRAGGEWLPAGGDDSWLVLRGGTGSQRNLYASMRPHPVTFTGLELLDAHTARLHGAGDGFELTVTWSLAARHPRLAFTLLPAVDGHAVVGYQAFGATPEDQVDEVLCGPVRHGRMVGGPESVGLSELTAPLCLVQRRVDGVPVTAGIYVPPSELPFRYEPSLGDERQPFGMTLRNEAGQVQPVLFAPQLGDASQLRAGRPYRFELGVYAAPAPLYDGYRELLREVYDYRPYRRNVVGTSLTETVHHLIDLVKAGPEEDDGVEFRPSPSGWWSRAKGFIDIENDQAVRTTSTAVLLGAALLTGDEELYEQRARPTMEFHLSRNGYGWTPVAGHTVYGDPSKHRICAVPFGSPALAALDALTAGRVPAIRRLAADRQDDEDYWLKRAPMSAALADHRMTGDPERLRRAEELADEYIAAPEPAAVDPHDFQIFYTKAWVDLLELYEETGERRYLDAAYREAKRYVTQVFVRPVPDGDVRVPDGPLVVDGHYGASGWWDPDDLYRYPDQDVPESTVPRWVLSPNGMSFEALKTYQASGYTMNPAWAPFLLRLAAHTGDDLLRDIAHNAVVGRYTNYPGYYLRQFTVHHLRPDFPYRGPFPNTTIYYHHIPVQLGMTIDYLMAEHQTRSAGNIRFPSQYEQNYVWFGYRVYGHRPGRFYGYDGAWPWLPRGLVDTGNEQVNWVAAEAGDRVFVSLTSESDQIEPVRLRLDPALVPMEPGRPYRTTVIRDNGPATDTRMVDHALDTEVSAHGITAVIVHDTGPVRVATHTEPPAPPSGPAYRLDDDTPLGPVWGIAMVTPDNRRYDAYVQAATEQPATLCWSVDGGRTYRRWDRPALPNEWTVPVPDLTTTLTYYVEAGGVRTDPVELTWAGPAAPPE